VGEDEFFTLKPSVMINRSRSAAAIWRTSSKPAWKKLPALAPGDQALGVRQPAPAGMVLTAAPASCPGIRQVASAF
jgi:hypothetical protein